ncbi:MAG: response regulator transcription factor [Chloroflexota bacterium]|jgi:DNA-binding NarL/FixJ family response regulator
MLKILIVDDHAIVRKGVKQILESENDLAIISEAQNGLEALQMSRDQNWDLIILDINLPEQSGLDVLKELHYKYPKLPILIMSMFSEDQYAIRVLKSGASGYLNKQSVPEELVKAVKKISAGGKYVSDSMAELLATNLEPQHEKSVQDILSDREYQVLLLIASGKTVSEIGEKLCLSVKTISTFRARILSKMNLKNNAELTYFAIHNDLID